ncbi:aminotransferase class I/II-fold pyridoxal phosphate-dependent enzyme [Novosphingobium aquiterrae]|uniref:Aminotransferase class I/II-fold pyridoxal phosphate-dependent enzyme n=1 Tax=Novosphingobium aquiterrae TaxID=624388 RepID=A0ABV6PGU6_9SPHN
MTSLAERLAVPRATTVFERMSALARETGSINLGQGFPDLPDPPELIAAAQRALAERSNQYPPMRGLAELRAGIAAFYAREQGQAIDPEKIVVTSGATEALAAALLALVAPRDEVILVQPCYDAYAPLVTRAGGTVRYVSLAPPHWTLDPAALAAALGPKTRGIVLNTPNNPVGTVLDRATLEAIGALCAAHDLWLVCDEVWEGMILDGTPHCSALDIPALAQRTVKIGSAGKIFSLTGWKVGWAVAAPPLAAAVAAQHQFLTFTTATPLQWAVAEGLALPPDWHRAHRQRYAAARAWLCDSLTAAGYCVLPASGTWFVTIDLAASGLPADDEAVAQRLIAEARVAAIPVSAFYAEQPERGFLRLCFAKDDVMLDEAAHRLAQFRS